MEAGVLVLFGLFSKKRRTSIFSDEANGAKVLKGKSIERSDFSGRGRNSDGRRLV